MRTPTRHDGPRGTRWTVRFRINGRQTSETFTTRREAESFARDLDDLGAHRARQRLEAALGRADALTVDATFTQFFAWKEPRVRSDRTIKDYRRDYRLWIKPTFGTTALVDVDAGMIQRWVDSMVTGTLRGKPSAPKSIVDRHALLHQVLGWAAHPTRALIEANPATSTDLPKKRRRQPKGLNPNEWAALRSALVTISTDGTDLADFLLATGWRWSEATALTTLDVEDNGVNVWVTMQHVARRTASGFKVVDDGKGEASLRRVQLDPEAARMVRRRVLEAGPLGLVFTTKTGVRWHYSNFRERVWQPAVKASQLSRKPTPHWLRHTAVVWLAQVGATLPELQRRIGHQNISTTIDVYGSMITDVQPDALNRFAALRSTGKAPAAVTAAPTPDSAP